MLTREEEQFLAYWSQRRTNKRRVGLAIGFRAGVLIAASILVSVLTGWHKRAAAILNSETSNVLVIFLAAAAIVVFMMISASRYQWEQREQRYNELLAKKEASRNG